MGRAIFISYRRDDTEGEAGRLFDDLVRTYGNDSVFMDVAGINPGVDFRRAIDDNVATCGVLLAVIGPTWATIANSAGQPRLHDENDFVRLEIASALARDIPVIPVLVHDAKMPHPEQLPENLRNLAYRNSVEITHARWNSDVQLLTQALAQYVAASGATSTEPVHATVPVQLPPPQPLAPTPAAARSFKAQAIGGVAALLLLAAGAAIFVALHHGNAAPPAPTPVTPVGPAPVSADAFSGTWTNPDTQAVDALERLQIADAGDQLTIHAWARCQPTDCDWGSKTAPVTGQTATAVWDLPAPPARPRDTRVATITVTPANGSLNVTISNTFGTGKANHRSFTFTRTQ